MQVNMIWTCFSVTFTADVIIQSIHKFATNSITMDPTHCLRVEILTFSMMMQSYLSGMV